MSSSESSESSNPIALEEAAGGALFRLGRLFGRLTLQQQFASSGARDVELSRILVVQAVEAEGTEAEQEVAVGDVAQRLAIDPSTASRLVADAIKEGYLSRTPSQHDGRRAQLALTDAGRTLAAQARDYQHTVFMRLTRDWTAEERTTFARLFITFADAVAVEMQADSNRR